tara:strand:- start:811 stop:1629 length:819 start_codon:yes stop_codon:yes gene_type:complete
MKNFCNLYSEVKKLDNNQLRKIIRLEKYKGQTSGLSKNFLQTNLIILDKKYALDFMIFCQRNPKSCPVVGVTNVGDPFFKTLGDDIDVRSDVPSYNIYRKGKLHKLTNNISDLWNENLIAFAIGCSFTFEHSLIDQGFRIDHVENNKVVPMYRTNIKNKVSGPFKNTMVVSMRIFKKDQINDVTNICKSFHWAHGKPIHVGDPKEIGILDVNNPDWGHKPRTLLSDELNVFWACGVTPQNAILSSKIPLCISHTPGHMLITDVKEDAETPIL